MGGLQMEKMKKTLIACLVGATVLGSGMSTVFAKEDTTAGSESNNQVMYIPTEASISPKSKTYIGSTAYHPVKLSWWAGAGNSYRVIYYNGEGTGIDRTTSDTSIDYSRTYQKSNTAKQTWNTSLSVSNGNTARVTGSVILQDR